MNSSDSMPLNPHTPMSYLTPSVAKHYMISTYINFFTMGILAWDWLMSMPEEYRILWIGRWLSLSKITYFSARVFTITTCFCACILYGGPVSNCPALAKTIAAFIVLTLNTNNILFFSRVRAVYGNSLRVTVFFGFCYMVVFVTSTLVPYTLNATHIGPTAYCVNSEIKPWISALSVVFNAVNDTLVFLAISYRIASVTIGGAGWCSTLQRFFRGDGAPRVAKELLQNGQLCYLSTIVLSMAQIILGFTTEYGMLLTMPCLALEHVMTCRVHRAVIFGLIANKQPPNAPFVITTFVTNVAMVSLDDRLDAKKPLELQEGEPA